MKEKIIGEIVVAYSGNFANKMQWQEEKLDKLKRVSDLSSNIVIKSITQRVPSGTVQMGDTMALIGHKNPLELNKTNQPTETSHTRVDVMSGMSEVLVDDQLITEKNIDKKTRRVKEVNFISDVNKSVKAGLSDVITKEKLYQAKISLDFYKAILPAVLGITGGLYITGNGLIEALSSLAVSTGYLLSDILRMQPQNYDHFVLDIHLFVGMAKFMLGTNTIAFSLRISRFLLHEMRPEGKLAFLSLNPLSAFKDILNTKRYLSGEGKDLVLPNLDNNK